MATHQITTAPATLLKKQVMGLAFAARLNAAFDHKDIPIEERAQIICEACGVSLKTATRLLNGETYPKTKKAFDQLADRLCVHPAWLWLNKNLADFDVEDARHLWQVERLSSEGKKKHFRFLMLLNNGSVRAQNLADMRVAGKISTDEMMNTLFKHSSFFVPKPGHTAKVIPFKGR